MTNNAHQSQTLGPRSVTRNVCLNDETCSGGQLGQFALLYRSLTTTNVYALIDHELFGCCKSAKQVLVLSFGRIIDVHVTLVSSNQNYENVKQKRTAV